MKKRKTKMDRGEDICAFAPKRPIYKYIFLVLSIMDALLIFYLSSRPLGEIPLFFRHRDKVLHFLEFLLFSTLVYITYDQWSIKNKEKNTNQDHVVGRSMVVWWRYHSVLLPFIISFVYALSDEFHQYFVPTRMVSAIDLLSDTLGAGTGIFLVHTYLNRYGWVGNRKGFKPEEASNHPTSERNEVNSEGMIRITGE